MTAEFNRAFDALPALVWTGSPAGDVEFVNRGWVEYAGLTCDAHRGRALHAVIHPDDLAGLLQRWTMQRESGEPGEIAARLRRADGSFRRFVFRGSPMRDDAGRIARWIFVGTDVEGFGRVEETSFRPEADVRLLEDAGSASEKSPALSGEVPAAHHLHAAYGGQSLEEGRLAGEGFRSAASNLTTIINTIPALAWSSAPEGAADFFSQHFLDYVGLPIEAMQGWGWTVAVHPEDLSQLAAVWQAVLVSGEPGEAEARLRRSDGQYRWFLFRTQPLRDNSGKILKWYGVNTDIEDRKVAEKALEASERKLRQIINTIPALAWSAFTDGTAEFFNQHYLDYVGIVESQMEYWRFTDNVHPDDLDGLIAIWQKLRASGEPGEAEARLRQFDGTYRWFLIRANPLRDETGNIVKWYGTHTDIDDRKWAEERLRRSEAFLAEGQRLSMTGSFSWRVDTGEITLSDELYRIFELAKKPPVTLERINERVHPEDLQLWAEKLEQARAGPTDLDYEMRLQMPDGRVKYLRTFARGVRHKDGRLECICAVQDVTDRRHSEEALGKLRSDLAHVSRVTTLGAMAASIAHEVNQPLAGIITNASTCLRMLAASPPNVDGARETARRTIRDGNRAADVITRLRALFSRKAAGIEPVDLNDAAREVIALIWSDVQRSRVLLRSELAEGLPPVAGDRVQLQQVIMNLLRNACDAMNGVDDRPRLLLIRTEPDGDDHLRLSVQDSGVGVGADGAEQLFQAFYTTKDDGMGIGLSVSRSIIESHQGRLWAAENDGPGATFAFSIPVHRKPTLVHNVDPVREIAAEAGESGTRNS